MADVRGMEWQTIQAAEWPEGVRCMDCQSGLSDGAPYIERLAGFVGEDPATELVCLPCGGVASPSG
jgi:hypothetical protein